MSDVTQIHHRDTPDRFNLSAVNRILLTIAVASILCAASMLALQSAGPEARAMTAGEGILITGGL